jgi:hypothetical protein
MLRGRFIKFGFYVRGLACLAASAILLGPLAFLTSRAQTSPLGADNQAVTTQEDRATAITLTAHDPDGKPLTYSIVTQPSHGFVNLLGPRAVYTPNADYNGPDSFTFKANNGALDSNIATVSVTITPVNHPPVARYTANPASDASPLTVTFDATSSSAKDGPITSYTWDFGDGTTGSGATVTHNYSEAGTHSVKLTVSDKNGATGSASSLALPVGTTARFALIGDYGSNSSDENRVANLVKGWNPDFVVTVGDNNYPHGEASTIDQNIGKYYHSFIGNYKGSYGSGSSTNRFWPSLGNHDWDVGDQPYLNYFTLPNNERYYNVALGGGLLQLFVIDSDSNEPDGMSSTSKQANWLKSGLAASTACFKLVDFHHPPYTTWSGGYMTEMQWPFPSWGADIVLTGHAHVYERLDASGFPYIVNGLGGEDISTFGSKTKLPSGVKSVVRYNSDFGAMLVNANTSGITYQFYSAGGNLIDTYTQSKSCTGVSGSPAASLSPTSLTFPSQTVGTASAAQAVTLANSGSAALSITGIAVTGTNSGDFGQTNNCGSSLAAGSSCAINVTFTPTATGTRSATLTVTDNASNSPQTASLTGAGVSSGGTPTATLSRTSLTFGNQTVGTSSPAQSVTLSNSGGAALSISSFAITGDFGQTNNCGSSVAAGSSCTINMTFTPTATGTRSGTLTVTDNAGNSPQTVSLTGTGVTGTGSGPAFVQVQNNIDVSGAAFTSFSVPITTNPGHLLVAFCRESSNGTDNFTVTDSAGQAWTQTASSYSNISGTGPRSGMFYVANSAAVTSVTVQYKTSGGVIKPGIMVMEISGAVGAADGSVNHASGASVPTSSSGSLSTTNAKDILIFATDTGSNETGWTAGAGYAIPNNNLALGASGSNVRMAMQYAVVSSPQTNTTTSMTSVNSAWNGNIFAAFQ